MKIPNILHILKIAIVFSVTGLTGREALGRALEEVTVTELSSTQKSMVIDRGLLENFKEGTLAKFFLQVGDKDFPKIFLVAEGKIIKSFPKKSYFYLSQVHLPKLLIAGEHLLILSMEDATTGRSLKIKQRHVVVSDKQYKTADEYLEKNTKNVPDRLLQNASEYEESDELYSTKTVPEADMQVQTYEHLKKKAGTRFSDAYGDDTEEKFFIGNREVKLADIKKGEDKKLLDSMALGLAEKINSQKYGLTNGLYKNEKKPDGIRDMNDRVTLTSVYEDEKTAKKEREYVAPQALAKIARDGGGWSEDMDNVALRRYFIRTGLERESRRRELVLNELEGNEIMFHYSGSMTDHSSTSDENYRALGYTLGFGYDWHLARTSQSLKNWSLQFAVDLGVSDYDVGGQNARGQEGYYGAYLNYYVVHNPLTLNSFIWLVGAGVKAGSVKMESAALAKKYSYQALSLPALQIMTKYRFRAGDLTEDTVNVGASFNAGIQLDVKRLSVIDSLDDDINGKISVNDLKYLVGMSVFF